MTISFKFIHLIFLHVEAIKKHESLYLIRIRNEMKIYIRTVQLRIQYLRYCQLLQNTSVMTLITKSRFQRINFILYRLGSYLYHSKFNITMP